jgi:hypothetical protein
MSSSGQTKDPQNNSTTGDGQRNLATIAGNRLQPKAKEQVEDVQEIQRALIREHNEEVEALQKETTYRVQKIDQELRERAELMRRAREQFSYKKPLAGPGFYGLLLLVAAKDILDVIINIIELFADATIILGIIIWIIDASMSTLVFMSTQLYFYVNGVPMNKQKAVAQTVTTILKLLPLVSMLPVGAISFVIVRYLANKEAKENAIQALEDQEAAWQQEQELAVAQRAALLNPNMPQNVITFEQPQTASTPQALEAAA